jgi:hypothetical protein
MTDQRKRIGRFRHSLKRKQTVFYEGAIRTVNTAWELIEIRCINWKTIRLRVRRQGCQYPRSFGGFSYEKFRTKIKNRTNTSIRGNNECNKPPLLDNTARNELMNVPEAKS